MKTDKTNSSSSCGLCLEFAGFVSGEICGGGALEAVFAVDGGVDLAGRKNEPVL
jgi:hypothetical protein